MYSRAGLVALILAFLIAFTAAAPVPTLAPPRTSLSHRTPYLNALGAQTSFDITQTHADNQVLPSAPIAAREVVSLERRRFNLFSKVRHAFKNIGHGIKRAAQKVRNRFKSVAKKAGRFLKTSKIAKVGLKITATATKVASKVAEFMPGVGGVLSKGLGRASSVADAASNRIPGHFGGKLGKVMAGMDEAEKIASYIPRGLSEGIQLQTRDLEEVEFDARDAYDTDGLLDARADLEEWLYARSWDDLEDSIMY